MHAADADDDAACMGCLLLFGISGHRERRPGASLGPIAARPMASAYCTSPLGGCQVHCVLAHARRVQNTNPRRFPQMIVSEAFLRVVDTPFEIIQINRSVSVY
jgi:hypothetical protein